MLHTLSEHFLVNIVFDTAKSEPSKMWHYSETPYKINQPESLEKMHSRSETCILGLQVRAEVAEELHDVRVAVRGGDVRRGHLRLLPRPAPLRRGAPPRALESLISRLECHTSFL